MSDHIPVFCATDENYAPFASLTMRSILMNTHSFIDFYIMDGGIKEKTKKMIDKDLKQYPNKSLHYIDMKKYDLSRFPDVACFTVNMYSRYFIPDIVSDVKKVIYLDVDIIVKKDIAELYNQDLEHCALAAMSEIDSVFESILKRLKRIYPKYSGNSYFNSGVLLLDVQKLIEMNFTQKAVDLTSELRQRLDFPDQDVLNILFANNYKKLDYRFNFMATYDKELNKFSSQLSEPVVIHYAAKKPWKEHTAFDGVFEEVLNQSVFKKRIIQKWRSKKVKEYYLFGKYPIFKRFIYNKSF